MEPEEANWRYVRFSAALLVAAFPFVVNYLTHHVQGKSADYQLVYYIIVNDFTKNLLNQPAAMLVFLTRMFHSGIIYSPSLLGLLTLWLLLRHDRSTLKLVLLWVLGILTTSMLLPWMEQSIERFYRSIPIETELVRSIRYLVFFMLIFCLWPLSELSRRLKISPCQGNRNCLWDPYHRIVDDCTPPQPECFEQNSRLSFPRLSGLRFLK